MVIWEIFSRGKSKKRVFTNEEIDYFAKFDQRLTPSLIIFYLNSSQSHTNIGIMKKFIKRSSLALHDLPDRFNVPLQFMKYAKGVGKFSSNFPSDIHFLRNTDADLRPSFSEILSDLNAERYQEEADYAAV